MLSGLLSRPWRVHALACYTALVVVVWCAGVVCRWCAPRAGNTRRGYGRVPAHREFILLCKETTAVLAVRQYLQVKLTIPDKNAAFPITPWVRVLGTPNAGLPGGIRPRKLGGSRQVPWLAHGRICCKHGLPKIPVRQLRHSKAQQAQEHTHKQHPSNTTKTRSRSLRFSSKARRSTRFSSMAHASAQRPGA